MYRCISTYIDRQYTGYSCRVCFKGRVTSSTTNRLNAVKDFRQIGVIAPKWVHGQATLRLVLVSWLPEDTQVNFDTLQTALRRRDEDCTLHTGVKDSTRRSLYLVVGRFLFVFQIERDCLLRHQSLWWQNTFWNTYKRTWLLSVRNNTDKHDNRNTFIRKSRWKSP